MATFLHVERAPFAKSCLCSTPTTTTLGWFIIYPFCWLPCSSCSWPGRGPFLLSRPAEKLLRLTKIISFFFCFGPQKIRSGESKQETLSTSRGPKAAGASRRGVLQGELMCQPSLIAGHVCVRVCVVVAGTQHKAGILNANLCMINYLC